MKIDRIGGNFRAEKMLGKLVKGKRCLRTLGGAGKELGATAGKQTTYKKNGQKNPLPKTKIQNTNLMIRRELAHRMKKNRDLCVMK